MPINYATLAIWRLFFNTLSYRLVKYGEGLFYTLYIVLLIPGSDGVPLQDPGRPAKTSVTGAIGVCATRT